MIIEKKDLEEQLLYFVLKDSNYLQKIFFYQGIKLDNFSDENNRYILDKCINYHEKYHKILIKEEFENLLEKELQEKKIDEQRLYSLNSLYDDISVYELKDEQFDRILENFIDLSMKDKVKELLLSKKDLLDNNHTTRFISDIINGFNKIITTKKDVTGIETFDVIEDTDDQMDDIKKRRESPELFVGLPTGWSSLDRIFPGFELGTLSMIGALINTGKSTAMINISRNLYELYDKKVMIISLEMPRDQWMRKYNSLDFKIPYSYMSSGDQINFSDEDVDSLEKKLLERKRRNKEERNGGYKGLFIPSGTMTWNQIVLEMERNFPAYKPDIIFVDYIALISLEDRIEDRNDLRLGSLAKDMRAYALKNKTRIVTAGQANRGSVFRKAGKKQIDIGIDNIEDSNKIGAHLDNFIALMPKNQFEIFVKIAKARDGAKETVLIKTAFDRCAMFDPENSFDEDYNSSLDVNEDDTDFVDIEKELDEADNDSSSIDDIINSDNFSLINSLKDSMNNLNENSAEDFALNNNEEDDDDELILY